MPSGLPPTVASMKISRNAPCPCGSGLKHKRCCLAAEREAAAMSRRDDAVGARIIEWAGQGLREELDRGIEEITGPERRMPDHAEMELLITWLHHDRALPNGHTPAQLYAARPEIDATERGIATRIADARIGIHRVTGVKPGRSLELEDLIEGSRIEVRSDNVSREAARWDVLLARVMAGEPPSLWGPARFFSAAEEPELLEELERRTRARGDDANPEGLRSALRADAFELFHFVAPSAKAERSLYTPEGDRLAEARASWPLRDPEEARERLATLGGLEPAEEPLEVEITAPYDQIVAQRGDRELPPGAVVIEAGVAGNPDLVSVATVRVEGERLSLETMSEERLAGAMHTIERDFGDLLGEVELQVSPIEDRLAELGEGDAPDPPGPATSLDAAEEEEILREHMLDRWRRWTDEPHPRLGGATPREAVAANRGGEVLPLLRVVENGAARSAGRFGPLGEIDLIGELGLDDELAA